MFPTIHGILGLSSSAPDTPAAPTFLFALAVSSSQIDLFWIDNSDDETGFKIYQSTDNINFSLVHTTAANVTDYSVTSLTAETEYFYYVVATNANGDSDPTNTASATTYSTAPVTGPFLWLKADAGVYTEVAGSTESANNDPVGRWEDQSGNGRHFNSVSNGTQRPTFLTDQVNGLPIISADGVNDYLRSAAAMSLTDFTIFLAMVAYNSGTGQRSLYYFDGSSGFFFRPNIGTSTIAHFSTSATLVGGITTLQPVIVTISRGGGAITLRINGIQVATENITVPTTNTNMFMFAQSATQNRSEMDAGEMLVYNSSMNTANTRTVEEYLADRWGIRLTQEGESKLLWVRADRGTYENIAGTTPVSADNSLVGYWENIMSSGYPFAAPANDTRRPLLKISQINGLPVVRTDGINDYLASVLPLGIFSLSMVVVPRQRASVVDSRLLYQYDGTRGWFIKGNYDGITHFSPAAGVEQTITGNAAIITIQRTATNIKLRHNGVEIATDTLSAAPLIQAVLNIGWDSFTGGRWTALDMAEIIIRNAVDADDTNDDESYLSDRYNIPLNGTPLRASALTTPTYDGSGQAMHPSVYDAGSGNVWPASGTVQHRYWMGMTPYPNGNDSFEDASILCSDDGITWAVPDNVTNPISESHSDPHLLLAEDGYMYLYYRTSAGNLRAKRSNDGWQTISSEITVISSASDNLSSPVIRYDGSQYVMWSTHADDSPYTIRRRTSDDPDSGWSSPTTCTINNAPSGRTNPWNIDIIKASDGNWLALIDFVPNGVLTGKGHFAYWATSSDGLEWDVDNFPILWEECANYFSHIIYKIAIVEVSPGVYDAWPSGSAGSPTGTWRTGYARLTRN
jgi:hypothetical protein